MLLRKYKTASDYAGADPEEFQEEIRSTGFFRQKTKSVISACADIVEKHQGEVPQTMEELSALHGVGRKTANVVLSVAYGKPAIPVDTHVRRVSGRLGLTGNTDPDKIEQDLMEKIPKKAWSVFSHTVTLHGRRVCVARKPRCAGCVVYVLFSVLEDVVQSVSGHIGKVVRQALLLLRLAVVVLEGFEQPRQILSRLPGVQAYHSNGGAVIEDDHEDGSFSDQGHVDVVLLPLVKQHRELGFADEAGDFPC